MNDNEKTTSDIYFAAALLAKGAYLEKIDRTKPRHMTFTFSGDDLDSLEMKWVNKELEVNALDYRDAIQRMKSIVHE